MTPSRRHISLFEIGLQILVLGHLCGGQASFQVSNPKHQQWPQEEANRIYFSAARELAAEFNRSQSPSVVFTVVLGANENSVDMNAREIRLKKWDKYLYAEGVVRLTFDQMLSTEAKMRFARRAVAQAEATVDVHTVQTAQKQGPQPDP
jgi:hypothetical protein